MPGRMQPICRQSWSIGKRPGKSSNKKNQQRKKNRKSTHIHLEGTSGQRCPAPAEAAPSAWTAGFQSRGRRLAAAISDGEPSGRGQRRGAWPVSRKIPFARKETVPTEQSPRPLRKKAISCCFFFCFRKKGDDNPPTVNALAARPRLVCVLVQVSRPVSMAVSSGDRLVAVNVLVERREDDPSGRARQPLSGAHSSRVHLKTRGKSVSTPCHRAPRFARLASLKPDDHRQISADSPEILTLFAQFLGRPTH